MRKLIIVAMFAIPLGCAHRQDAQNLAKRQAPTAPSCDFEKRGRNESSDRPMQRTEPPTVTPPVP